MSNRDLAILSLLLNGFATGAGTYEVATGAPAFLAGGIGVNAACVLVLALILATRSDG